MRYTSHHTVGCEVHQAYSKWLCYTHAPTCMQPALQPRIHAHTHSHVHSSPPIHHTTYTPGSTGSPKGVVTSQRCVAQRIAFSEATYRLKGGRILVETNYAFSGAEYELVWAAAYGGTMVIAPPQAEKNPLKASGRSYRWVPLERARMVAGVASEGGCCGQVCHVRTCTGDDGAQHRLLGWRWPQIARLEAVLFT